MENGKSEIVDVEAYFNITNINTQPNIKYNIYGVAFDFVRVPENPAFILRVHILGPSDLKKRLAITFSYTSNDTDVLFLNSNADTIIHNISSDRISKSGVISINVREAAKVRFLT